MSLPRHPGQEPIPGYRLLEPLGSGGFGEVWKCEAPGGLLKAIKFVHGARDQVTEDQTLEQELRSLGHVRTIRHPFLLALDRVEVIDGQLVVVAELAERSLHDLLEECHRGGLFGIPRDGLIAGLREAAEALDLLGSGHGLQHLDVKPRNLLLMGGHVKVGDFGLVSRLDGAGRGQTAPISPAYAAPELFQGTFSKASDQYSLALAYHELLTGQLPFRGKNPRQLALQHARAEPDLDRLPEADRPVLARALAKDPAQRWDSCAEFVQALAGGRQHQTPTPLPIGPAAVDGATRSRCPAALAAYEFEECLARGEYGEAWMARTAEGPCTVMFLYGMARLGVRLRRDGLARMGALGRPPLVPGVVVRNDPNRMVVAYPRLGPTLRERHRESRTGGLPGIPRAQLLRHLRGTASALDTLAREHGLAHLALTPDVVQLTENGARVIGAGLAALLRHPAGQSLGRVNPNYASPELWSDSVTRSADSYALAVIYQEMLTGRRPFTASFSGTTADPDLGLLPPEDRAILARALDPSPDHRFPTCTAFIDALEAVGGETPGVERRTVICHNPEAVLILEEVIAGAAGGWSLREQGTFRYLLQPGTCLRHQFVAGRTASEEDLEGLFAGWGGRTVEQLEDRVAYQVPLQGQGWARLVGRPCGLDVRLHRYPRPESGLAEIDLEIKPFGCGADQSVRVLDEEGARLVADIRKALDAHPDRRAHDRVDFSAAVEVRVAGDDVPVRGRAMNLSRGGIGLYLPSRPESDDIYVYLPAGPGCTPVPVPARVVRARPKEAGFDVGALFLSDAGVP